jgi:hypothetical protein
MIHGSSGIGEIVFFSLLGVIAYACRPAVLRRRIQASEVAPVR